MFFTINDCREPESNLRNVTFAAAKAKFNSKRELATFLAVDGEVALPPFDTVSDHK